jgi:LuxR family maltose regulon positive regulatory protein
MMMTLPLEENTDFVERQDSLEPRSFSPAARPGNTVERPFHIFAEKLRVPRIGSVIERPRLYEMLEKSCTQFGATLVSGRAGTGKTTVAAGFAARYPAIAWYSVESADSDWTVFSHYFNAALMKTDNFGRSADVSIFETSDESRLEEVSRFVSDLFSQAATNTSGSPLLIVLDDIQHLFDSDWFNDFFTLLLHSLLPDIHLLMLCRSKPPLPLWRLRSKQRLNVIDEKLLAFSPDEAEKLYRAHGLPGDMAKKVHRASFGRASKLAAVINSNRAA